MSPVILVNPGHYNFIQNVGLGIKSYSNTAGRQGSLGTYNIGIQNKY